MRECGLVHRRHSVHVAFFLSLSFSSSLHIIRIHSPLIRMQISVCICVCVENLTLENISIWFEEMHGPFFSSEIVAAS